MFIFMFFLDVSNSWPHGFVYFAYTSDVLKFLASWPMYVSCFVRRQILCNLLPLYLLLLFSPILCIFGFGIGAFSKRDFVPRCVLVGCLHILYLFSILAGPKGFCSLASLCFAFILFFYIFLYSFHCF